MKIEVTYIETIDTLMFIADDMKPGLQGFVKTEPVAAEF